VGADIATRRSSNSGVPLQPGRRRDRQVNGWRRRADSHAVVASILAVLALVGCVIAILLLATQPTAARLEQEIGSLNTRLGAARSELVALQAVVGSAATKGSSLRQDVSHLGGRVAGLQQTVHGLQSSTSLTQEQAIALRDCVPQLQRELFGLILKTRSVNGRVTSVGLSEPALVSPACQPVLSGR
jgi:septal ring factor EnvC (AmiA/AmiB activator)